MITEKDLHEAIAECQGERNPNANTCIKLASYYTILSNMKDRSETTEKTFPVQYSYDLPDPVYTSGTEFGRLAETKDVMSVMKLMDELMETIRLMYPRLYDATMAKMTTL